MRGIGRLIKLIFLPIFLVSFMIVQTNALTYTVQRGDKLEHIAARFGVSVEAIAEANHIKDINLIVTGSQLTIPETSADITEDSEESIVSEGESAPNVIATNIDTVTFLDKSQTPTAGKSNTGSQKVLLSTEKLLKTSVISINVRQADIRDVLSAIAVHTGANVIFKGEPVKISIQLEDITPVEALDNVAKAVGMVWLQDGDIVIFGDRDGIKNDYLEKLEIAEYKLKYITSQTLAEQIKALELQVNILHAPANSKSLWVQGFAGDLVKVRQIIRMLDKNANLELGSSEISNNFRPVSLEYISAGEFKSILEQLTLPSGFLLEGNPNVLYIYASNEDFDAISTIRSVVDVVENYSAKGSYYTSKRIEQYRLSNISSDVVLSLLSEMGAESDLDIKVFSSAKLRKTLWLVGSPDAIGEAKKVISDIDISGIDDLSTFEVFRLYNVTADEMAKKLQSLSIPNLRIYNFPFSQFGRSIMVSAEADYMDTIAQIIDSLDRKSPSITLPIDSSTAPDGANRLHNRRILISELSGISSSQFKISSNIAKEEGYRYIMYLTASPEEIQRVKELIAVIDGT